MPPQPAATWPDSLNPPEPAHALSLLTTFWEQLEPLADLLQRDEWILAERLTVSLRDTVIEMMLAMNGIAWPAGTAYLNGYLGESQRKVLERTLETSGHTAGAWIARAVALVVIYRWYAVQIVERFGGELPVAHESRVLNDLAARLPGWPARIETE